MSRRGNGAQWFASNSLKFRVGGVFVNGKMTVSLPRGVRAESEDCPSCLRTKFGQILAEIPAKFENPSPNSVRGQS